MEKTHFGESVFGDDDDDDVKKNELKTRGGCSFSSFKAGDRKERRVVVASPNARRRQTDRISKTKKDIISLDPASRRRGRRKMMTINTRDLNGTTNRKEEKSHHPPDTRDEVDDQNRPKRR